MSFSVGLDLGPNLIGGGGVSDGFRALYREYGGVYWDMQETTGTTVYAEASTAGTYDGDNTGATVAQAATSRLGYAYLFDGANDYVDIYNADFNTLFDETKGALILFGKVSGAGVWTDGNNRYMGQLLADSNNSIIIIKSSTNNTIFCRYRAGGTNDAVSITTSTTDYFMVAITWDTTADQAKVYFNGVQSGSTQTGLGTWAGNLDSDQTLLGASTKVPATVFSGYITHASMLTGVPTAAQLLNLAQLGGVA